jgi:hypothetical protein
MNAESEYVALKRLGICHVCQQIVSGDSAKFMDLFGKANRLMHHPTITSFQAALEENCYICTQYEAVVNLVNNTSGKQHEAERQAGFTRYSCDNHFESFDGWPAHVSITVFSGDTSYQSSSVRFLLYSSQG